MVDINVFSLIDGRFAMVIIHFLFGIFHGINHEAIGVPPWLWTPPHVSPANMILWLSWQDLKFIAVEIRFYQQTCGFYGGKMVFHQQCSVSVDESKFFSSMQTIIRRRTRLRSKRRNLFLGCLGETSVFHTLYAECFTECSRLLRGAGPQEVCGAGCLEETLVEPGGTWWTLVEPGGTWSSETWKSWKSWKMNAEQETHREDRIYQNAPNRYWHILTFWVFFLTTYEYFFSSLRTAV